MTPDRHHGTFPLKRFPDRVTIPESPAFLVGFAAEARIARRLGWRVETGGGTAEGAQRAVRRLIGAGVSGIVSFGLAGGLDPALRAGTLIVAEAVSFDGRLVRTDPALSARLGGTTGQLCLGLDRVVASVADKRRLARETGAALVDLESAAAAASGLPFAVLRAVCDPAERALPPAAVVALDAAGHLAVGRLLWSILTAPGQIGALTDLARDAAAARRALRDRVGQIARGARF